jgi:hypothetical protein
LAGSESEAWSFGRAGGKYRILWTPRWCTNEGNCNFFDYKDDVLAYCDEHSDVDFVFRPHPQAFLAWNASGELPEAEAERYRRQYAVRANAKIDGSRTYLSTFYSSDCLISDISSIIAEYFLTGKPVVYCHKKDCFNDFSRKLSEGFYWVRDRKELFAALDMLRSGEDPLKETRQRLIQTEFSIPLSGAGNHIKDIIKNDAIGSRG